MVNSETNSEINRSVKMRSDMPGGDGCGEGGIGWVGDGEVGGDLEELGEGGCTPKGPLAAGGCTPPAAGGCTPPAAGGWTPKGPLGLGTGGCEPKGAPGCDPPNNDPSGGHPAIANSEFQPSQNCRED